MNEQVHCTGILQGELVCSRSVGACVNGPSCNQGQLAYPRTRFSPHAHVETQLFLHNDIHVRIYANKRKRVWTCVSHNFTHKILICMLDMFPV